MTLATFALPIAVLLVVAWFIVDFLVLATAGAFRRLGNYPTVEHLLSRAGIATILLVIASGIYVAVALLTSYGEVLAFSVRAREVPPTVFNTLFIGRKEWGQTTLLIPGVQVSYGEGRWTTPGQGDGSIAQTYRSAVSVFGQHEGVTVMFDHCFSVVRHVPSSAFSLTIHPDFQQEGDIALPSGDAVRGDVESYCEQHALAPAPYPSEESHG